MLPTERPKRWDTTSQNTRQVLFHGQEIETTPIIGRSPTCHSNMLKATSLEFDLFLLMANTSSKNGTVPFLSLGQRKTLSSI